MAGALHERLVAHVMAGERVRADDTPLPVLDPAWPEQDRPFLGLYPR